MPAHRPTDALDSSDGNLAVGDASEADAIVGRYELASTGGGRIGVYVLPFGSRHLSVQYVTDELRGA